MHDRKYVSWRVLTRSITTHTVSVMLLSMLRPSRYTTPPACSNPPAGVTMAAAPALHTSGQSVTQAFHPRLVVWIHSKFSSTVARELQTACRGNGQLHVRFPKKKLPNTSTWILICPSVPLHLLQTAPAVFCHHSNRSFNRVISLI